MIKAHPSCLETHRQPPARNGRLLSAWRTGLLSCFIHALVLASPSEVRVWETNLVIPTYLAAPPSPVPRFYDGRTYQGAKATFYPYPVRDVLTDVKSNVAYQALFLENQHIQISVLPELGGRERLEKMGMEVHALCAFDGL